ncbi:hypothetical protein N0O92_00115 [Alkalihalobacillus sp. MEB130]|uniref:hypothetical protein n=1 Tax=Alkalihalobacillus sp. MEB130 TaxID=2976704 RepID=UPI0028DE3077|nr:hypothetical protein [Alkalihalobacillus sp. MEB130]MDT8858611.1 hypothetical protein [Alkalihalobacillus sp. MEB130]
MNAWVHLLKKELRLGMSAFLVPVLTFLLLTGVAAYFGSRHGFAWEVVFGVALFATGFQVFYLVYYLLHSLHAEKRKMHLWLHSTMPAYGLLLAKVAAGIISLLVTLLITGTVLWISLYQAEHISEQLQMVNVTNLGIFGGTHLLLAAISFAGFTIFYWMVYLLFNRYLGSFLSLLATLAIFVIGSSALSAFKNTAVYEWVTTWGEIHLTGITESINFETSLEAGTEVTTQVGNLSLYFGFYVFEAMIVIALFVTACWMLDRKVEV